MKHENTPNRGIFVILGQWQDMVWLQFLKNHPVGHEFTADNLPLHISIVDSFEIGLEADELALKLARLLADQKSFKVKALADEMYGPEKDILVTTLELTPELKKLHDAIVGFLKSESGMLRYPHFNGDHFSPHVSVYGDKRVNAGDDISIEDVSLSAKVSDADDANRRILANFIFQ